MSGQGEQDSKNSKQVGVGIIDLTISGEGAGALMNVVEVRNLENVPSNADNNPKVILDIPTSHTIMQTIHNLQIQDVSRKGSKNIENTVKLMSEIGKTVLSKADKQAIQEQLKIMAI